MQKLVEITVLVPFQQTRLFTTLVTASACGTPHRLYNKMQMASLLIPEKVVLRLIDSETCASSCGKRAVHCPHVCEQENDFKLGPFATDAEGVVTIVKRDLLAEASAHYDSGLMDYNVIEDCQPVVEIAPMEPQAIEQALVARTNVWKTLSHGSQQRSFGAGD